MSTASSQMRMGARAACWRPIRIPRARWALRLRNTPYDEYGNQLTDYTWSAQSGYGDAEQLHLQ